MAGANNRALKAAGIPKATIATLRVEHGAGLSLRSAISIANERGLPVGKAHEFMAKRDAAAAKRPEAQQASAEFRAKVAEHMKAAATARPAPKKAGGPVAGRISSLRKVPLTKKTNLDVRVTPAVLREFVSPNLANVRTTVNRRERLSEITAGMRRALATQRGPDGKAPNTLRFSVKALGEGGPVGASMRDFHFKARLLPGKGKDGKSLVAVNLVSVTAGQQSVSGGEARRASRDLGEVAHAKRFGANVGRDAGAMRITPATANPNVVPFKHRGETVYAIRTAPQAIGGKAQFARVVNERGEVVRNREAIKRGARVARASASRTTTGPSPAMQRSAARAQATASANAAVARREALVAAAASRRNRVNPGLVYSGQSKQTGKGVGLFGVEGSFAHQGKAYKVKQTGFGTMVFDASGRFVSKPKAALRKRAERVARAIVSRAQKKGDTGMRSRIRGADEY